MEGNLERFIAWTKLKIRIHVSDNSKIYFREKEIWWASLGVNIGYEQDGKNNKFERPVVILKKINKNLLLIVPTTTKNKDRNYYYKFCYNNIECSVILTQIRLISSKRLLRKIGMFPSADFVKVKNKIKSFL